MKTFSDTDYTCQQGELTLVNLDRCPEHIRKLLSMPERGEAGDRDARGRAIVGHSETGHHHVLADPSAQLTESADPFVCYLRLEAPTTLDHLRADHTHTAWELPAGNYWVSRQREGGPERWRAAQD
jgi:hypothetical protein